MLQEPSYPRELLAPEGFVPSGFPVAPRRYCERMAAVGRERIEAKRQLDQFLLNCCVVLEDGQYEIRHATHGYVLSSETYRLNAKAGTRIPLPGFSQEAFRVGKGRAMACFEHFARSSFGQREKFTFVCRRVPWLFQMD